jgi:hypothetical protein
MEDKGMRIHFVQFRALTLAVLALTTTLRAEDFNASKNSDAPKKKVAAESPKVQSAPKPVSPKAVTSTALSETLATNITVAPGTDQFIFAKTDFTGADTVRFGFYAATTQDLSKTNYVVWWAIPNATQYAAADSWAGTTFYYLNTGSYQVSTFGNQLGIDLINNGTAPVTYTQVTVWANAR